MSINRELEEIELGLPWSLNSVQSIIYCSSIQQVYAASYLHRVNVPKMNLLLAHTKKETTKIVT